MTFVLTVDVANGDWVVNSLEVPCSGVWCGEPKSIGLGSIVSLNLTDGPECTLLLLGLSLPTCGAVLAPSVGLVANPGNMVLKSVPKLGDVFDGLLEPSSLGLDGFEVSRRSCEMRLSRSERDNSCIA